jgi:hypothetical protein
MGYLTAISSGCLIASFLLIPLPGCSTGAPSFVKYTNDSAYVIFSDAGYIRSYVHQIDAAKTVAFDASFACEDAGGRRWILEPAPLALDQTLLLLSIEPDGSLAVRTLPKLPSVGWPVARLAGFGPGENQISIVLCRENFRDPKWRAFRLDIGQREWQEVVSEPEKTSLRRRLDSRPDDSIAMLGYVPPSEYSFKWWGPSGEEGKNVRQLPQTRDWSGTRGEYQLPSPDGKTLVTVRFSQPSSMWALGSGEVRLTDVSSEKTRVLMGNTAIAAQVFQNYVYGPCAFVVLLAVSPHI